MNCEPNKYQKAILDWAENGTGNALIEARAGCGKTSTLIMLANLITEKLHKPCLFLAFNDHIAKEIKEKLQEKVDNKEIDVRTVNSMGNSFLWSYMFIQYSNQGINEQYDIRVDDKKMYRIGSKLIDEEFIKAGIEYVDEEEIGDIYYEFKKLCDLARLTNIPYGNYDAVTQLMIKYRLFENVQTHGIDFAALVEPAINQDIAQFTNAVWSSIDKKNIHMVDYADQIFLPNRQGMYCPKKIRNFANSFVLCDEAQDLSNAQQRLIQKCATKWNTPRFIFVADERQAIYGFAGADTHSVDHLKEKYNLNYFPLNICYRCPKSHIKLIQQLVPDIECNPNAKEGEVHLIDNEEIASLAKEGDYIIARKNKDLVQIMLSILKQGKSIYIKDKNLVSTTVSNIRKLQSKTINGLEVELKKLQVEFQQQQKDPVQRVSGSAISNDEADIYDTIFLLLENYRNNSTSSSTKDFIKYLSKILNTDVTRPSVILSSVHGVKGGESNTVFVVSHNRFPYIDDRNSADQNQQERNLEYIAISRSKDIMYLCQEGKD